MEALWILAGRNPQVSTMSIPEVRQKHRLYCMVWIAVETDWSVNGDAGSVSARCKTDFNIRDLASWKAAAGSTESERPSELDNAFMKRLRTGITE